MNYSERYKRRYKYKSKTVKDGLDEQIKDLRAQNLTFAEIGLLVG